MPQFRKKPVVIQADQWFKNGDHPEDGSEVFPAKNTPGFPSTFEANYTGEFAGERYEGNVVRYFRRPDVAGESECKHCGLTMHAHGWVDTVQGGHTVCPGDWIITDDRVGDPRGHGHFYPCKPDIFAATYEPA